MLKSPRLHTSAALVAAALLSASIAGTADSVEPPTASTAAHKQNALSITSGQAKTLKKVSARSQRVYVLPSNHPSYGKLNQTLFSSSNNAKFSFNLLDPHGKPRVDAPVSDKKHLNAFVDGTKEYIYVVEIDEGGPETIDISLRSPGRDLAIFGVDEDTFRKASNGKKYAIKRNADHYDLSKGGAAQCPYEEIDATKFEEVTKSRDGQIVETVLVAKQEEIEQVQK